MPHVWKSKKASLCSLVSKFRREQLVRSRTQQQEEASPKSRWRVSIFPLWSTTFDSLTVTSFLTLWSMRWVLQVAFGKSRVMLWYKEFYIYIYNIYCCNIFMTENQDKHRFYSELSYCNIVWRALVESSVIFKIFIHSFYFFHHSVRWLSRTNWWKSWTTQRMLWRSMCMICGTNFVGFMKSTSLRG